MTTAFSAANAYSSMARLAQGHTKPNPLAEQKADLGNDFSNMVKASVDHVVNTGNQAERKAADMMAGKANVVDVVTAVAETEVALSTMVSVRDRVISAYEEIMRMPI